MAMTQVDYEARIRQIGEDLLARADSLIAAGWEAGGAFEDAAWRAAGTGNKEATIQMMNLAAAQISHRPDFLAWWNARFEGAELCNAGDVQIACPCIMALGDKTGAVIAPWSDYLKTLGPAVGAVARAM